MGSISRSVRWLAVATTAVLVAACSPGASGSPVATLVTSSSPSPATAVPSHAPLAGVIVFFDFPPDSRKSQVYIEHADGTSVRRLVTSTFDDRNPAISPDGRRVAFTRYLPDGSPPDDGGVFVVNLDGTGLTQIDPLGEDVAWSPDGKHLVDTRGLFDPGAAGPYNVALWVMNSDGSNKHQITLAGKRCSDTCPGGEQHNEGVWSPDGKRIAFKRDVYTKPEQFSIYTVAADGSDLRRVTPEGMNAGDPAWSPDGTLIAFQSPPEANEGGEQNIFTIHADGSGIRQLTSHLSMVDGSQGTFHPSWSPDGRQILFSHNPGMVQPYGDIFVMNADGTDVHGIASTTLNENWPNWGVAAGG
jgi:Tol biopolymer transport system component